MKSWDVIIIGGGIIGLSLSIALQKRGLKVIVVERGEPGREASHAAAGMLAASGGELPPVLRPLAAASFAMYPEFAHELQDESGMKVDLREEGTIVLLPSQAVHEYAAAKQIPASLLPETEPAIAATEYTAVYLPERSVDPRALTAAALKAAKHRGVDISSGTAVVEIKVADGHAAGVRTDKTSYAAGTVVNCAGAWAGQLTPQHSPTRPVKGQMLAVVAPHGLLRHVVRAPEVYLVPRSDSRIVIGSTLEEAGFDKRTDPDTITRLHHAALRLLPDLGKGHVLEAWAGLRPGTPDDLPILGATATPGYFVATGHFRDGILLAPVTAEVMADLITAKQPEHDISAFSPMRFG